MARHLDLSRLALLALAACSKSPSKLDELARAPSTRIQLDGEWDEPSWNQRAVRGVFAGPDGTQARPYSEIRLLRDETHLIIGVYAADEDIRSSDAFEVAAGTLPIKLYANGRAEPATVRAAVDRDGTIDDAHDDDEEWVIEAAVPLAALGPPPLAITAKRCDRTKDGVTHCGTWQQTIDPKTLPR